MRARERRRKRCPPITPPKMRAAWPGGVKTMEPSASGAVHAVSEAAAATPAALPGRRSIIPTGMVMRRSHTRWVPSRAPGVNPGMK